mmetsp:Transcript_19708/g.39219  ORF Transcript_19708/g.39219 Transcript_19708/m.39219 type:complete len:242 (-) Transcript_19708:141-866(-)
MHPRRQARDGGRQVPLGGGGGRRRDRVHGQIDVPGGGPLLRAGGGHRAAGEGAGGAAALARGAQALQETQREAGGGGRLRRVHRDERLQVGHAPAGLLPGRGEGLAGRRTEVGRSGGAGAGAPVVRGWGEADAPRAGPGRRFAHHAAVEAAVLRPGRDQLLGLRRHHHFHFFSPVRSKSQAHEAIYKGGRIRRVFPLDTAVSETGRQLFTGGVPRNVHAIRRQGRNAPRISPTRTSLERRM